jgi:predicted transcriptional regulator
MAEIASMAATVRIRPETHEKLQKLANETGQPMLVVLDEAVESLRRQRLLQETNRAFEALRSDPKAWQAELMERRQWEATLGDDLKD